MMRTPLAATRNSTAARTARTTTAATKTSSRRRSGGPGRARGRPRRHLDRMRDHHEPGTGHARDDDPGARGDRRAVGALGPPLLPVDHHAPGFVQAGGDVVHDRGGPPPPTV